MKRLVVVSLWGLVAFATACGQPGSRNTGDDGGGSGNPDGGTATCGNGIVETGEQCDDGNTMSGDGCSATCQTEPGGPACAPNSFRCGAANDVEQCNNAGTAWLVVQSCATTCAAGACADPMCTPMATRCHGDTVETCNATGDGWTATQTCTTFCASGQCAQASVDVTSDSSQSGTVIVAGDFVVEANSTLTASSGDLTIVADNIRVEAGGSIAVAQTGTTTDGASCNNNYYGYTYSANYGQPPASYMMQPYGGDNDAAVQPGSLGGANGALGCAATPPYMNASYGGGRLRLIATHDITIAGSLLASGMNQVSYSGGSGGGIQIAADTVEVTGSISTAGGSSAGYGRVRLLYGTSITNTGTIIGTVTQGLRPPLDLTSPTHPDPTLTYNDAFDTLTIAHERPIVTAQGYLHTINNSQYAPPTAAAGTFAAAETFDIDASKLTSGDNYVHLASMDQNSTLGTVESRYHIKINSAGPVASSTSHPSATTWYPSSNPYFAWTNPGGLEDSSFRGVHYVLDHTFDTLPTLADTRLAITQKQILISGVADGVWVFHVISEDTMGRLTKTASNVVVRIGADPGNGTIFGTVTDDTQKPVSGATVRVNHGIWTATTNAQGSYTLNGVPAGTWDVDALNGMNGAPTQSLQVTAGQQSAASFVVPH